jgi:putative peptide zinc metalloprotease protein
MSAAPRLLAGVTLTPRSDGVIVAHPDGRRHFRVEPEEGRLLKLLDGSCSLEEVHACLAREFPAAEISPSMVAEFVQRLADLGLLEGIAAPAAREPRLSSTGLLYLQVPLGNPDRFFRAVVTRCPVLFTRAFWSFAAALMLLALWVGADHWDALRQDGFHYQSLPGLLLIWASLSVIGTIHEMGHGLTCTYLGAPSTRWGLLLIYLVVPCAFCDVSGAWRLPEKRHRLAVGAAGLAFQWVAGAIALLFWRVVEPGTLLSRGLATMAGTCGLASLLNLWPFLRLDGYYMLSDLLELPNLRSRATALLRGGLSAFLFGGPGPEPLSDRREARILALFGLGLALWSGVMLWLVGRTLLELFVGWWGGLGALAAAAALVALRGRSLWRWMPGRGRGDGKVNEMSETVRRRGALPALVVGVGAVLLLGRWELNVSSPCKLEAVRRAPLRAAADGVLAELRVREGDRVRRGTILGTLETFETGQQLTQTEARLHIVQAEQAAIETRIPVVAAQTEQLAAETRANLERAHTDLDELAQALAPRIREADSQAAGAAAEAQQALEGLQEARAAVEAQSRLAARLRADLERSVTGDYPPAIAALAERLRKCRSDRELAERERDRAAVLVAEGALASQSQDRASAAAEARGREEEAARSDLAAGLKNLREATEDAEAELFRRHAARRAAAAALSAARAAHRTAGEAARRVRAQSQPGQLTSAQRQVEARGSALTAALARRGEVDARRREIAAKRLEAERLRAQIAVLRRRLKDSALVSPVDGIVTTPRVEEKLGRHFDKGATLFAIEQPAVMLASLSVPEKEIGAVRLGQPVHLKVAPFPERTFTGTVDAIAPVAQPRGSRVICEVRLRIPNPDGDLRAGMSGWAKIACGEQPLGALLTRRVVRYLRTEAWSWF